MTLVDVRDLRVELAGAGYDIVDEVTFTIAPGEVVGLVGESGSGKTTIGTALLGHVRRGARIAQGSIFVDGVDVRSMSRHALRRARGKLVAYIPQDPAAALNPSLRVGRQLGEMLDVHEAALPRAERAERVRAVLAEVNLPSDDEFLKRYPHQLSGGQAQRVAVALAFVLRPKVIVLDEPTTGLDVTTQAHVLSTVRELCGSHGIAALYVSHDLAVIANLAHRVLVVYAGRIVEEAACDELFARPAHPYTHRLLATIPTVSERRALNPIPGSAPVPGRRPPECFFAPRCPHALPECVTGDLPVLAVGQGHAARCIRANELVLSDERAGAPQRTPRGNGEVALLTVRELDAYYGSRRVLHKASLSVRPQECVALVGESGSGKTTLGRSIVGLAQRWEGEVLYAGEPVAHTARGRPVTVRRQLQYIFQSPYNALNPRRSVGESIAAPLEHFLGLKGAEARKRVASALERVSLPAHFEGRFPEQLSGGERQRVAIARALVCDPSLLICDEVTSALDVSVQASIVRLLKQLQEEEGLALLFVTHNLALVRTIADRVVVLERGRVVETGLTDEVLDRPQQPYTRTLLADTPTLAPAAS